MGRWHTKKSITLPPSTAEHIEAESKRRGVSFSRALDQLVMFNGTVGQSTTLKLRSQANAAIVAADDLIRRVERTGKLATAEDLRQLRQKLAAIWDALG